MPSLNIEPGEFPYPISEGPEESRYLTWIRNHSNYLTPRGFLDYLRAAAVLLRGILINFLTLLPLLLVFAILLSWWHGQRLDRWNDAGAVTDSPFILTPWVGIAALVWFLLGYALYATVYGALGSLASRSEDAQAAAGPVMAVLMVGFFASFVAVGRPHSGIAQLASFFPATAPLTMPNRIAMGAAAWWEPLVAVAATLAAIVGLVLFGGRVYTGAVLHIGPTLKLRDAWRRGTAEGSRMETTVRSPHGEDPSTH